MPSTISIRPNRITITPRREPQTAYSLYDKAIEKYRKSKTVEQYTENFKAEKNAFKISRATKKKIFDSINFLYALSKPKTIEMQNGKKIYNHRATFLTLTLPSTQKHTDVFLKKECLNQLLVELRKHYNFQNYVWKAELQKNENIHFHIVTDVYLDFQAVRRRWNRILNKYDYVKNYQEKMQKLSLSEYHAMRNKSGEIDFKSSAHAFASGCASNWSNPNSIDIRSAHSSKDLGAYLAKYIAKDLEEEEMDEQTTARGKAFGRIWSRSQSLCLFDSLGSAVAEEWQEVLQFCKNATQTVKTVIGDYYKAYYFNLDNLPKFISKQIYSFFYGMAQFRGYPLLC